MPSLSALRQPSGEEGESNIEFCFSKRICAAGVSQIENLVSDPKCPRVENRSAEPEGVTATPKSGAELKFMG
jgi:hypothetical protein